MNQFNFDELKKRPSMLLILGGNLLTIIGCFLPFVSLLGMSTNYFAGDGKIVVVLCIAAIVIALFQPKFAFIADAVALLITFIAVSRTASLSLDLLGIGAYIIILATIAAIVGSVMEFKKAA